MNPKYVVSLELSERLKAAGFPQKTERTWYVFEKPYLVTTPSNYRDHQKAFAAPMTDELLEHLPETLQSSRGYLWRLNVKPLGSGWTVEYQNHAWMMDNRSARKRMGYSDEEIEQLAYGAGPIYKHALPDALAELWLYCKENNLLEEI